MQKIENFCELEEPLWSAVAMRATHESYIDLEDEQNSRINIERWVTGTKYYVECDSWVRM